MRTISNKYKTSIGNGSISSCSKTQDIMTLFGHKSELYSAALEGIENLKSKIMEEDNKA